MFGKLFAQVLTSAAILRTVAVTGVALSAARVVRPRSFAFADEADDILNGDGDDGDDNKNSLDSIAAELDEENSNNDKIKAPMSFDAVEGLLGAAYVDSFEGARMIVQKQVNLNTVVSHFYHLGMAQRPTFYRYSMILADPIDGTRLTVHTEDLQNINGDLDANYNDSLNLKAEFALTEKGNTYTTTANYKMPLSN